MKIYNDIKDNILSVKLDKRTEVYNWGTDNSFPSLVETLINLSVTSKTCVDQVAKSIYGKSFGDIGKIIINSDGQSLNELLRIASREFSKYNNVFLHIRYNGLFQIKGIKILPTQDVRVGKSDDLGYSGKFIVYNNWDGNDGRINRKKFKVYDRFNLNNNVIQAQVEAAGNISSYSGQILQLKKEGLSIYSLPDLNPVLYEALLEKNSQIFRSNGAEKGFQNTKVMTVQPFSSDSDRRKFNDVIQNLQGAENSGKIILLESGGISDDLNNQMKLDDLTSEYNDKLYEYSDTICEKNISKAFGVPLSLVDTSNDGLFGNSGELLREAKKQLWESREEDRDMIEEVFTKLMTNFEEPIVADLKIISPIADITTEKTPI